MTRRILLLDTGREWGGGTNSLLELLRRIDRERLAVTAAFYHDYGGGHGGGATTIGQALAALGIPFLRLPARRQPLWAKLGKELVRGVLAWHRPLRARAVFAIERAWRIRPRALELARLLREGTFDVLYLNNQPSSNLEGYLAAEAAGIALVQHCRIDTRLNADEVAAVNRVARAVICVSHGVAESLRGQGVDAQRLVVVPNGIDGAQALPAPLRPQGVPAGAVVVGAVGSLIQRKCADHLLQAVASLGAREPPLPPIHVVLVGDGPQREALRSLATTLGIAGRVHFTGFQGQPLPWLAGMDVLVLASSKEGLPRVILEAMLLGKPVVAANVVGSRELVLDGATGFLYEHGDVAALAARLAELAADPARRGELGARGRARVLADYSIENYVQATQGVLARAPEGRP